MRRPSEHVKTPSNRIAFSAFRSLFLLIVSASPLSAVGMPNNSRCPISNKSQCQSAHGPHLSIPHCPTRTEM